MHGIGGSSSGAIAALMAAFTTRSDWFYQNVRLMKALV
jgi:hypothetical protein